MVKAVDRGMIIGDICLVEKRGGRSGHYRREANSKVKTQESKKKAKLKKGEFLSFEF